MNYIYDNYDMTFFILNFTHLFFNIQTYSFTATVTTVIFSYYNKCSLVA